MEIRRPWRYAFSLGLCLSVTPLDAIARTDALVVGGTGAALGFMRKIGEAANQDDPSLKIQVLPSIGSTGGVRALTENVLSLALVGRSLTPAEVLGGVSEAVCFLTPFVFVTSTSGVSDISRADLISYFAADRPTWRTGAAVRVILRPVSDAATPFLSELLPGMAEALARARTRGEIPVAASDQDNLELAASVADSLAGAPLVQLLAEPAPLTRLSLDGVPPTVDHMTRGVYPRGYRICVARGRAPSDDALRLIAWMRKPGLEAFYASLGMARQ